MSAFCGICGTPTDIDAFQREQAELKTRGLLFDVGIPKEGLGLIRQIAYEIKLVRGGKGLQVWIATPPEIAEALQKTGAVVLQDDGDGFYTVKPSSI